MRSNTARLAQNARIAGRLLNYILLGLFWFVIFRLFIENMLPRFAYLAGHAAIRADWPCMSPECDFSAFWPAGVLAWQGQFQVLFQPAAFLAWRSAHLVANASRLDWYYPPQTLLPAMAASRLPFEFAFFAWTVCLAAGSIFLLRLARLRWLVIGIGLLSPACLNNFQNGQLGLFTGSVLLAGLLLLERSPGLGGVILGLLVFKPQAGLLAPLAVLAAGKRPAPLAALLTVAGILLLTTALLGWPVWWQFLASGPKSAAVVLERPFPAGTYDLGGLSVFWMMRSFGAGLAASYAAQSLSALAVAILTWWLWARSGLRGIERAALTAILCSLATPYGYTDDMVGYSIALAALAQARGWRIDLLDTLFWLWPALCPIVSLDTGILFTPAVVSVAAARVWVRAGLPVPLWPAREPVLPDTL
jgi:hypothetical protein